MRSGSTSASTKPTRETYRGREGAVYIPAGLSEVVEGVFGLDNRRMARRAATISAMPAQATVPLTPPEVAGLYQFPAQVNVSGETIGLMEFGGGYTIAGIQTFFSSLSLPMPSLTAVGVDGVTNSPGGGDDAEVALDIDVAGSVASGAKIAVYFAPWTEQGWVDAITTAVQDTTNKPSALSISWGWPENQTIDGLDWTPAAIEAVSTTFQEAAVLGVTVFAASGDYGSGCGIGDGRAHVLYPASDPWLTSCGGTTISNVSGSSFTQTTWPSTGWGVSDIFAIPAWQDTAGIPVSANGGGHRGRGVPDVAGNADPDSGYTITFDGTTEPVGGTSAVAPLYAGLVALLNASLGEPVGYLNPRLYSLRGGVVFREVDDGVSNASGGAPGYTSGPGWNACTGLGSINGNVLLSNPLLTLRAIQPTFQALSSTEAYVLGENGNLWHETGPWGTVPPPREEVDGNVAAFQALSGTEAYVLGENGNLWHETGPWGTVPPPREEVLTATSPPSRPSAVPRPTCSGRTATSGTRPGPGAPSHRPVRRSTATSPPSRPSAAPRPTCSGRTATSGTRPGPGAPCPLPPAGRRQRRRLPGPQRHRGLRAREGRQPLARDRAVGHAPPPASRSTATSPPSRPSAAPRPTCSGRTATSGTRPGPGAPCPPPASRSTATSPPSRPSSGTEAYVRGDNGNLWHETGPWGTVPPASRSTAM